MDVRHAWPRAPRCYGATASPSLRNTGVPSARHVVHPYPTTLNPSASRSFIVPDWTRYSVTTFEPGAMLVFTNGFTVSPRSTAFRASRPAPIMTDGFDVFVHDVIAAITTAPWPSAALPPFVPTWTVRATSPSASP